MLDSKPGPPKTTGAVAVSATPAWAAYCAIARPDHWIKNLFVLPGLFLAALVGSIPWAQVLAFGLVGMVCVCLVSSANYTINEWLDRHFDRFHPQKRSRPSVKGRVTGGGVWTQYSVLGAVGLAIAAWVNTPVFLAALALLAMGLVYNVRPARTKDRAYLDVVSESINNPIRLCLGWLLILPSTFPPSSLLLGYWFGGAFLMAVKRLAEYRTINDPAVAGRYRRSFQHYSERSLLASSLFHAMSATLFLGVFLVKYRIELILSFPFIALLFSWYLYMGMVPDSPAQHPEKLFREGRFMLFVMAFVILLAVLFAVDLPGLQKLLQRTFSEL